ncbi:MAG: NGG1p interacting factor NIF3 [Pseudomonadota bacterium]|nr:NGG1p interacting factor NIF3 [Pseudomonadota bacterium]MEC8461205.1 NGG1p interacting factor NIF3 [Pseudomonadota bacterium]
MKLYSLVVFVPVDFVGDVKRAIFDAGAGSYAGYSQYCWQSYGVSQYLPHEGSDPFAGDVGVLQTDEDIRIETLCHADCVVEVLSALKNAHPYEKPAYFLFESHHLKYEDTT